MDAERTARTTRTGALVLRLMALGAAVAVAVWAGTVVSHRLEGPDPVATAKLATKAFSSGDCATLRRVAETPDSIPCSAVTGVEKAYRDEGLKLEAFRYSLVSSSAQVATVRISYGRGGASSQQLISLEKHGDNWKVADLASNLGS